MTARQFAAALLVWLLIGTGLCLLIAVGPRP